jgi:hypothetical protein
MPKEPLMMIDSEVFSAAEVGSWAFVLIVKRIRINRAEIFIVFMFLILLFS